VIRGQSSTTALATLGLLLAGAGLFGPPPRAQESAADVRTLLAEGRYVDGEALADRLYTEARAALASPGPLAESLDLLVSALLANGRGAEAKTRALVDLSISPRRRGEVLLQSGEFEQAAQMAREALALDERVGAPDTDVADDLDLLARALTETGAFEEALAASNRAIDVRDRLEPSGALTRAGSLEVRGALNIRRGEYASARADLAEALRIRETAARDAPGIGYTLTLFGEQQRLVGDLVDAKASLQRAVTESRRRLRPDHPLVAAAIRGLAAALQDLGALAESETLRQEALQIAERAFGPDHVLTAIYMNDLANTLFLRSSYADARRLYLRARVVYDRKLGPTHLGTTTASYNLGLLYQVMGDLDSAEREFRSVASIWQRTMAPSRDLISRAFAALAGTYDAQGRFAEAERIYRQALRLREAGLGPEHPLVGMLLFNLATTVASTGALQRASELSARSVRILERSGEVALPEALVAHSRILFQRRNYRGAADALERALSLQLLSRGAAHPSVGGTEVAYAATEVRLGEHVSAFDRAIRGDAVVRAHMRTTLGYLPERQALDYAATRPRGLDLALSLASTPAQKARAFDALILERSVILDEVASRRRAIRAGGGGELAPLWSTLTAARQRLANLAVSGPTGGRVAEYRNLLDDARREKEAAERALAERSAAFRTELARADVGLSGVEAALPADSALLSFVRFDRTQLTAPTGAGVSQSRPVATYAALVLRADVATPELIMLGSAATVDALVSRWREAIAAVVQNPDATAAERQAGRALRRAVWDPIAAHVSGARRLFLVPDGSLNGVPFAALPTGTGRYLLETGPVIHYLSAERDVVETRGEPSTTGRGLLVLGAPAFSSTGATPVTAAATRAADVPRAMPTCLSFREMQFPPLPWAGREARDVASLWRSSDRQEDVEALTGRDASEAALKRLGPGRRIIHLATHGFFLGEDCVRALDGTRSVGGLALAAPAAPPRAASGRPRQTMVENPLLSSGLVFAGANRRRAAASEQDDGILTAEEVAALDLEGVEWAVLSACDTGLGHVRAGEGVFGLRRAFQLAGVRTVVMSLWAVEDRSAGSWMRALYDARLRRQLDTADAVHSASLAVLADRRQRKLSTAPFYWAGFVASGDWR
jgi:CHAT domain-containing protein/tetratricopeptide (TPR) repeat protein